MLSIEEIKLLIEKLEKVKKVSLKNVINTNLAILRDIEFAVDANNQSQIDRLDKTTVLEHDLVGPRTRMAG